MSRAFTADVRYGRLSSPHPGELRLISGGHALPGETVVLYAAIFARRERVTCALCHGARVMADGACALCDGEGDYPDPVGPAVEVLRTEVSRYTVQPDDRWRAPDLGGAPNYFAVLVDDARPKPPLEWTDLERFEGTP